MMLNLHMIILPTHQESAISLASFLSVVSSIIHLETGDLEWMKSLAIKGSMQTSISVYLIKTKDISQT